MEQIKSIDDDGFIVVTTIYNRMLHMNIIEIFQDHFTFRKLQHYTNDMCDDTRVIVIRTIKHYMEHFRILIGNNLEYDIEWNVNMKFYLRDSLDAYERDNNM